MYKIGEIKLNLERINGKYWFNIIGQAEKTKLYSKNRKDAERGMHRYFRAHGPLIKI